MVLIPLIFLIFEPQSPKKIFSIFFLYLCKFLWLHFVLWVDNDMTTSTTIFSYLEGK